MATKTTETIEREVYIGKCPNCGKEITSQIEWVADDLCTDYTRKKEAKRFRECTDHLIGARIIDVDGSYHSLFPPPRCEVDSIVIATSDSRQFVISGKPYCENDPDLEIEEVQHPIKVERTLEDILQNCAKLRGVHGLSWRTLHEFFWFASACKWGDKNGLGEDAADVFEKYNGQPVGMRTSFDEMLTEWALLFEEYCVNEYGEMVCEEEIKFERR